MRNAKYASPARYTPVAQTLHWLVAALIVLQFTLACMAEDLPLGTRKLGLLARHKSFGMTILMLAVLRLAWRAFHRGAAIARRHVATRAMPAPQPRTGRSTRCCSACP